MRRSLLKQIINLIFPQAAMLFSTRIVIANVCVCFHITLYISASHNSQCTIILGFFIAHYIINSFFFFLMVNTLMMRTVLQPEAWGY